MTRIICHWHCLPFCCGSACLSSFLGLYSEAVIILHTTASEEAISKAELRLTDIAEALQGDWVALARQLGISEDEIAKIQSEYTYVSEQALVMLHLWVQKNRNKATG